MKLILGLLALSSVASATIVKPVPSERLFVPVGFDDNDNVVVTLDGYLKNSCYRVAFVEVKKDLARRTITVQQWAQLFPGECIEVPVPFTTTTTLGEISEGDFVVKTADGLLQEKLLIKRSQVPGPDDHLYAPVDSARVASLLPDPGQLAVIEGRFMNTCLRIKDVKLTHHGKTIEILPIMERTAHQEDGSECVNKEVPFVKTKRLPPLLPGRYLLHVRSLNGRSSDVAFTVEKMSIH